MYYYCRECLNMDLSDHNKYDYNECFCSWFRKYFNPNSQACSTHFDQREKSVSGCYLTTIMCEILNEPDDCDILKKMRFFRDSYLQINPEFYPILYEYDQIGPIIKEKLKNDNFKNMISFMMKELYLKPIILNIENKEYDKAIILYREMFLELKNFYKLNDIEIKEENKTKVKQLGHGYFVQ